MSIKSAPYRGLPLTCSDRAAPEPSVDPGRIPLLLVTVIISSLGGPFPSSFLFLLFWLCLGHAGRFCSRLRLLCVVFAGFLPVEMGLSPYFFMKRSTLPALSTSFCFPVKKGWHAEQISSLYSGLVERVCNLRAAGAPEDRVLEFGMYIPSSCPFLRR